MISEGQLAAAASTAVVQAMANDTYRGLHDRIKRFFSRHSAEPERSMAQLDGYSDLIIRGRSNGDSVLQDTLASVIEEQFAVIIERDIQAVEALRLLADDLIGHARDRRDMGIEGSVIARNNKAKGDQFIAGRDNNVGRGHEAGY